MLQLYHFNFLFTWHRVTAASLNIHTSAFQHLSTVAENTYHIVHGEKIRYCTTQARLQLSRPCNSQGITA